MLGLWTLLPPNALKGKAMYQTAVRRLFVTAIVRHPERVPQLDGVIAKGCDVNRVDDLASVLKDHDVVISSVHFLDDKADKQIDEIEQPRHLRCCFTIGY